MLKLLKAARQAYANAKQTGLYQFLLAATAALGTVLVHFVPGLKAWVALYGAVVVILDAMLEPWGKKSHETGAQIQEMFDAAVFELPPSGVTKPDPEVRDELADEFDAAKGDAESLKNWYPVEVAPLPIEQARLVCQRSNMQWDAKLRERVWTLYLIGLVVVVVGAFGWGLARTLSFEDFILSCMVPVLPAVVQLWRKLDAHRSAAKESEKARDRINQLWERVIKTELSPEELSAQARQIQDGLYERRRRSPQVPDCVYNWKRPAYEKHMKTAAADMVAQVSKVGVLSSEQKRVLLPAGLPADQHAGEEQAAIVHSRKRTDGSDG